MSIALLAGCSQNSADVKLEDTKTTLTTHNGRNVDIRTLTPETCNNCPLIIFSHGANAAYDRYDALLVPLARAGYQIAMPNHTDSEEHKDRNSYTPQDWLPTRLEDYNIIAAHYDNANLIAAGHSFGGLIAQIAGGAKVSSSDGLTPIKDTPLAVLAYSPPGPIKNYIDAQGWSHINVPSLTVTGTQDIVPNMVEKWDLHLAGFEAAPEGTAYSLVYENMDHYFNGAYGREIESADKTRQDALYHLNKASVSFLTNVIEKQPISKTDWENHSHNFVEARAR